MPEFAPESHIDNENNPLGGNVLTLNYPTLENFGLGKGSIGPENRTDIDAETYKDMLDRLSNGEFRVSVEDEVPVICVDGRLDENGKRLDSPSSAGGTLGLGYARVLSDSGLLSEKNESEVISDTISRLKDKAHKTSVHGDDHGTCGCGACAQCKGIFEHIAGDMDNIVKAASAVGVNIENSELIKENAKKRLAGSFFTEDRGEVLASAQKDGAAVENLVANHNELAIVLNMHAGTTIDRVAIREAFGDQYDVFVVDAWAFGKAAEELNTTGYPEETQAMTESLVVYNFATGSQLAHKSMPVIVATA